MSDLSAGRSSGDAHGGPPPPHDGPNERPTRLDADADAGDEQNRTRLDGIGGSEDSTRLDEDAARAPGWTDPARLPPALAARFPSVTPLPAGGQALVYRARTDDGTDVVVRVARPGVALAVGDVDLTAISSPHLVRVLETGGDDGIDFQILEYVDGVPLADALRSAGRLPELQLRRFVEHATGALATLSEARLVHGDIKPANVLMRGAGEDVTFVVIDFGLTRVARHTVVRDGVPGTLLYFPPEGCAGFLSLVWDWWSLGMVVAELLTGRHPLAGADPQTVHLAILNRRFDLDGITDPRWSLLVRGLLTSDHEHRWGASQVREWLAGGSPAVAAHQAAPVNMNRPLRFAGRDFVADPRRLPDAMGRHWGEAARMLGSPEARAALMRWARQFEDAGLLTVLDELQRPGGSLDQGVIRVIAALYDLPRGQAGGACRAWYRGRQLHLDVLHGLCAEALASADVLAGTSGEADDVAGAGALHDAISLVLGDLEVLAAACGQGRRLARVQAQLAEGSERIVAGTEDLEPPAEEWERVLWRIQLLSCLTGPDAAVAMRTEAARAGRRRADLRALTAEGSGPAEHLVATIRLRRRPSRSAMLRRAVIERACSCLARARRRGVANVADPSQRPAAPAGTP